MPSFLPAGDADDSPLASGPTVESLGPERFNQHMRYVIILGVVGLWMAIGIAGQLHTFAYLLVGIPLSLCWRRSGLLLVPALVHAFINAVPHVWSAP